MMTGFKEHKNDFITFAASQKRGIAWILSLCLLLVFVAPFYKLLMADLSPKQIAEEDKEIINILYDQQEQAEEQEAGPYTELKRRPAVVGFGGVGRPAPNKARPKVVEERI